MPDPRDTTAQSVITDQHKLPVGAYEEAISRIAESVFTKGRQLGVRVKFAITHPGTLNNDGHGVPYIDLSDKAQNQGSFHYEWAMDATEPIEFPPLGE